MVIEAGSPAIILNAKESSKMRKIIAAIAVLALALTMAACGGSPEGGTSSTVGTSSVVSSVG